MYAHANSIYRMYTRLCYARAKALIRYPFVDTVSHRVKKVSPERHSDLTLR